MGHLFKIFEKFFSNFTEGYKFRLKRLTREEINHHFQHAPNKSLVTKKLFSDSNVDKNWIYVHHTLQGLGNVFSVEYRLEIDEK